MKTHLCQPIRASLCSLLALTVALAPLRAGYAETPPAEATSRPALTVTAVSPTHETWDINIRADGGIFPWQEAVVAAEIGGLRITDVLVDVGMTVKKGQVLAKLSQDSIQAEIEQQRAVIAQSRSEVMRAESGILQAQAGVAQAEAGVSQAQAGVAQTEAGLVQVNANIEQAQAGLNQANAGISQANAGLSQANATFQEAKVNADRARKLKSTGALPMQQVDQYLTGELTARAGVESQKAAINAQKATLEAQKSAVNAQKAGLIAKKAEIAAKQAEVRSQQTVVRARLQDVKAQEAGVDAQQAALHVQEAAMRAHEIRLGQTVILAADDGVISSRSAALGAVVQAGTELFRIIRQNKLEWRAEVSGNELGQIHEQQPATVTLPTGENIEGEVRLISPTLDSNTRRASVYISLPEGSSARSGMFVQGTIRQGQTDALTLPQTAVILRDGRHFIFVIDAENRVSQQEVKTGRRLNDRVEILTELATDLKIVATGGAFLNEGDLVQMADAAPDTTGIKP